MGSMNQEGLARYLMGTGMSEEEARLEAAQSFRPPVDPVLPTGPTHSPDGEDLSKTTPSILEPHDPDTQLITLAGARKLRPEDVYLVFRRPPEAGGDPTVLFDEDLWEALQRKETRDPNGPVI